MAPKVDSLMSRDTQFQFDGDNLEQIDEEEDKEAVNAKTAKLIYNLSKNSLFVDEYWKTLPINLYTKTIKNQSNHKYKLMSNGKLAKDSVQILLGLISDLTLHGFRDGEKNETLEELSKLLK
jgi:hypothetical protein